MANVTKDALLKMYQDKIVPMSISGGGNANDELIDIISNYTWNANSFGNSTFDGSGDSGNFSFTHNIPLCYVIERRQTVNSNVANILATLNAGIDSAADTIHTVTSALGKAIIPKADTNTPATTPPAEGGTTPSTPAAATPAGNPEAPAATDNNKETPKSIAEMVGNGATALADKMDSIQGIYNEFKDKWGKIDESNLKSDLLDPYKFLYFTKETGKKYVFPLLSPTDLLSMTSSYADKGVPKVPLLDTLLEGAKWLTEVGTGITSVINTLSDSGGVSIEDYNLEMAKSFNFSSEGQELTTNFVLFNTVKKDAWKKHYRFLITFLLRNLPFKVSPYTFVPPLLYEVVVPGTKHLPVCHVSGITIQSLGKIRNLQIDDFIKAALSGDSGTMLVSVPEAWNVTIKFKCLLSNTANLILNLKNLKININSSAIS